MRFRVRDQSLGVHAGARIYLTSVTTIENALPGQSPVFDPPMVTETPDIGNVRFNREFPSDVMVTYTVVKDGYIPVVNTLITSINAGGVVTNADVDLFLVRS